MKKWNRLRSGYFYSQNRLNFIDVGRIVNASASLNFGNDGYIHVTFLSKLFLGEFFLASRNAYRIRRYFSDVFCFFLVIFHSRSRSYRFGDCSHDCGRRLWIWLWLWRCRRLCRYGPSRFAHCYGSPVLAVRSLSFRRTVSIFCWHWYSLFVNQSLYLYSLFIFIQIIYSNSITDKQHTQ